MNNLNSQYYLSENSKKSKQPKNIKNITMKPHQLTTLYKSKILEKTSDIVSENDENLYFQTNIILIGDKVGAGKSLSILAIISNDINCEDSYKKQFTEYNNSYFYKTLKVETSITRVNLIVVQHTLVEQWKTYIKKHTDYSYFVISTASDLKSDLDGYIKNKIILLSDTFYKDFAEIINAKEIKFQRIFYDDASKLKIPSSMEIEALKYYIIEEFPFNSSRNRGFISSLISEIKHMRTEYIYNILIKNTDTFINRSYGLIEPIINTILCENHIVSRILGDAISNNIIEMINAGDIMQVAQSYNIQICTNKNIIQKVTEYYSNKIFNKREQYKYVENTRYLNRNKQTEDLTKITNEIKELERQIELIDDRIKENDVCCICYNEEEIDKRTIVACCNKSFCFPCISSWLKTKNICPNCRTMLYTKDLTIVCDTEDDISTSEDDENKVKKNTENLNIILENMDPSSKILFFSKYLGSFQVAKDIFEKHSRKLVKLSGNANVVNSNLTKYKKGEIDSLFLYTTKYGSGINLEDTTDIIMFHEVDELLENQIVGRAQRPGRKSQLRIWKFKYENNN